MKKSSIKSKHRGVLAAFVKVESELKRYLLRFLISKEDVEDVLQETFIRASEAENKTNIQSPKAFLYKVAKNLALSEVSKKSKQIITCIEDFDALEVLDNKSCLEAQLEAKQELEAFYQAVVEVLPPVCRRVFLLRKAFGYSHKEIAGHLGISVSTVEKHLMKGMRKYEEYLESQVVEKTPRKNFLSSESRSAQSQVE